MRIEAFFVGAVLALIGAVPTSAQAPAATPELFGALPTASEAAISPDGKTVAVLQSFGEDAAVLFYDLDNPGAQPDGARLTKSKARGIEWATNDMLLLLASETLAVDRDQERRRLEFWRWVAVPKTGGTPEVLFRNEGDLRTTYYVTGAGDVLATLPSKPGEAVFSRLGYIGDPGTYRATKLDEGPDIVLNIYSADIRNGGFRRVAIGQDDTRQWIVDAVGEPVVRVDYDRPAQKLQIFRREGSGFAELASFDATRREGAIDAVQGLTPSQDGLYATMYDDAGRRSLVEIDLQSGAVKGTAFSHPDHDVAAAIYDPRKAAVTGVTFVEDLPRAFHFDPAAQRLQDSLARAIPGASPLIVSQSDDGSRMIVRAVYSNHPDQFFLFSKDDRQLDMFAPTYAGLDGQVVAEKEKYDFVASDGLAIAGYLTVPAGASKSSMPLIVLAHDGPDARSDMAFDYWSFFYAARGYLVYQPNFRGSDGYGAAFRNAGDGQWGRRMQSDITEGVRHLIADGAADPGRICIVGAGYGGYAALVGATLTPDLYACAVSVNGISDPVSLLAGRAQFKELAEDYWDTRMGSAAGGNALSAASPLKEASNAGAPVMLIHGRDDMVVPYGQSFAMADALKKAGRPHEFVTLDGEDHWLSSSATRTEMLARSIEFIDRHIGSGD